MLRHAVFLVPLCSAFFGLGACSRDSSGLFLSPADDASAPMGVSNAAGMGNGGSIGALVTGEGGSGGASLTPAGSDGGQGGRLVVVGQGGMPPTPGMGGMVPGTGGMAVVVPPAPPQAACGHAGKLCERLAACSPPFLQILFGNVQICTARVGLACSDEAKSPGSGLTAATSAACAAALAAASCEDLLGNRIEACVIRGTVATGAACGADSQCMTGNCKKKGAGCGFCATKGAAGETCFKDRNEECQPGLLCTGGVCGAPGAEGAACSKTSACGFNFFCAKGAVCKKLVVQAGATCEKDGCDTARNLACNEQAGVCQIFKVAGPGDACGLTRSPPTVCAFGDFEKTCRPDALSGVCARPGIEGEPCGPIGCLAPAYCAPDGLCKLGSVAGCK